MHKHTSAVSVLPSSVTSYPYAIGPIASERLAAMTVTLTDGSEEKLLVPDVSLLSSAILADKLFYDGVVSGLESPDMDILEPEYPGIAYRVNRLTRSFTWDLRHADADDDCYAWMVGYLLGSLSSLAQEDNLSARIGIAHLCYLMALVPNLPMPHVSPFLGDAFGLSAQAVRDYRSAIKTLKANGMTFSQAQHAALTPFTLRAYTHNTWEPEPDYSFDAETEEVA